MSSPNHPLPNVSHLDELESQGIHLIREAFHAFERPAMLWSMGKDSNVLIWLAKKAFCGHVPFPVVHIDTTYEFPEMLEFREWARNKYDLDFQVASTNLLNHVTYTAWYTTINSAEFGLPATANPMRSLQSTLRLRF